MSRTLPLAIVGLLIAALAALNWTALSTPVPMSLGVTVVQAPLGLLMLALTVLLAIVFAVHAVYQQGSVLMDTRRHTKELQAQRELADKAEASRFTDLRHFLEVQADTQMTSARARQEEILARIAHLEHALQARGVEQENVIAAHMGQLEDRLERDAQVRTVITPR